jgi:hypothetical protein
VHELVLVYPCWPTGRPRGLSGLRHGGEGTPGPREDRRNLPQE